MQTRGKRTQPDRIRWFVQERFAAYARQHMRVGGVSNKEAYICRNQI